MKNLQSNILNICPQPPKWMLMHLSLSYILLSMFQLT